MPSFNLKSLNQQIFIGALLGLIIGAVLTQLSDASAVRQGVLYSSTIVANVFVDLLKMVLIPLVFSTIVVGVANLQAHKQIHRVWISTLIFFVCSMGLAMLLGLGVMNLFRPGEGLHLAMFQDAMNSFQHKQMAPSDFLVQFLHGLFQNPFGALAKGDVLPVIIFALFLGVALVVGGERYRNILNLFQEFLDLMMRVIGWIMHLAPLGICALLIKLVATQNMELLATLAAFVGIVTGATIFHGVVILPLLLYLFTKKSPLWFWRGAREALVTAFATASSNATLPVTLRCVEQHLNVRKDIAGFVVPLGATINMDGTALYEAAAALFIANLAGIDLSLSQQLIVFCTAMIAAMGAPGIPSAGMVTMIMVLQSVGLPVEAIGILLPVDRLLDAFRTTVNVQGDMIGSVIVQRMVTKDE
jgi:Na+/H+-dicarboxylate symporter